MCLHLGASVLGIVKAGPAQILFQYSNLAGIGDG